MLTIALVTLFFVLTLLSSVIFIMGGMMAARTDARDEKMYQALLASK